MNDDDLMRFAARGLAIDTLDHPDAAAFAADLKKLRADDSVAVFLFMGVLKGEGGRRWIATDNPKTIERIRVIAHRTGATIETFEHDTGQTGIMFTPGAHN